MQISANLSTYVVSYLRYKGYSTTYADWIYITVARMFFQTIMMPFMGSLARKIGSRLCILIGGIIYTWVRISIFLVCLYTYTKTKIPFLCRLHLIKFRKNIPKIAKNREKISKKIFCSQKFSKKFARFFFRGFGDIRAQRQTHLVWDLLK